MLVLSRKTEQKIYIGQDVTLTILRVKGGAVQIGIEAPQKVRILRGEIAAAASHPTNATNGRSIESSNNADDQSVQGESTRHGTQGDADKHEEESGSTPQEGTDLILPRRCAPRPRFTPLEHLHHSAGPASAADRHPDRGRTTGRLETGRLAGT